MSRVFVSLRTIIVRTTVGGAVITVMVLSLSVNLRQAAREGFSAPSISPRYQATDGDPVDLSTGLYVRKTIDLALGDAVPIVFSRTYRTRDSRPRPFGVGTNHSYGSFLRSSAAAGPRPFRSSLRGSMRQSVSASLSFRRSQSAAGR